MNVDLELAIIDQITDELHRRFKGRFLLTMCVVGQLLRANDATMFTPENVPMPMHLYGMNATPKIEDAMEEYDQLRIEWTSVIQERLASKGNV